MSQGVGGAGQPDPRRIHQPLDAQQQPLQEAAMPAGTQRTDAPGAVAPRSSPPQAPAATRDGYVNVAGQGPASAPDLPARGPELQGVEEFLAQAKQEAPSSGSLPEGLRKVAELLAGYQAASKQAGGEAKGGYSVEGGQLKASGSVSETVVSGTERAPREGETAPTSTTKLSGGLTVGASGVQAQGGVEQSWTTDAVGRQGGASTLSVGASGTVGSSGATAKLSVSQTDPVTVPGGKQTSKTGASATTTLDSSGKLAGAGGALSRTRAERSGTESSVSVSAGVRWSSNKPTAAVDTVDAQGQPAKRVTVESECGLDLGVSMSSSNKPAGKGASGSFGFSGTVTATLERTVHPDHHKRLAKGEKLAIPTPAEVADLAQIQADPAKAGQQDRAFQVGDAVTYSVGGKVTMSLSAQSGYVQGGVRAAVSGEFDLRVENLGNERVKLTVTPTHTESITPFAGDRFGLLATASLTAETTRAQSQEFVFDLSSMAGQQAYQAALRGEMPAIDAERLVQGDPAATRGMTEAEKKQGFQVTRLAQVQTTSGEGKIDSLPLTASAKEIHQRTRETTFRRDAQGQVTSTEILDTDRRAREIPTNTWWSGRELDTASASLQVRTTRTEGNPPRVTRELAGLTVEETIADTKTKPGEMQRAIDRVSYAMGEIAIQQVDRAQYYQDTQVSLRTQLSPEQVGTIAALSPKVIGSISELQPRQMDALEGLVAEMRDATASEKDPARKLIAQAEILGRRLKADPAGWMATLQHVPDLGLNVQLAASSATYTDPVKQTAELVARDGLQPPQTLPQLPGGAMIELTRQIQQLKADTAKGVERLEIDPFLTEEQKSAHRAALQEAQQHLDRLRPPAVDAATARLQQALGQCVPPHYDAARAREVAEAVAAVPPQQAGAVLAGMVQQGWTFDDLPHDVRKEVTLLAARADAPSGTSEHWRRVIGSSRPEEQRELALYTLGRLSDPQVRAQSYEQREAWRVLLQQDSPPHAVQFALDRLAKANRRPR